jgi:hypothetical protein
VIHDEDLLRTEPVEDFRITRQRLAMRHEQHLETTDRAARLDRAQQRQRTDRVIMAGR